MAEYKINAPDSLYQIPKTYDPMSEAQIANLFKNVLETHAIKKLKMKSGVANWCSAKLAEKPIKDLVKDWAKGTASAQQKAANLEKALLGKMGMEIKKMADDIKKKYEAAGDKIIKPQMEKEWDDSQKRILKAMTDAVKKLK